MFAFSFQIRAMKKGRFDVTYDYDHLDRLSVRKDNYGNITQFFYNNHEYPTQVSSYYKCITFSKQEKLL